MVFIARLLGSLFIPILVFLLHLLGARGASAQDNPFPILPGLEASVEFWKLVFTRYSTSEVVFHDPQNPLKIYKVVPLGEHAPRHRIHEQQKKVLSELGGGEDESRVRAQRGIKERFASGLAQSGKYIDQIQQILREEGVPVEIAYLPLVESAFNVHARSRAGAVGMWQFMPATGRKYLRVGSLLDERKDPLESTRAAARLLKENYQTLGNWPLAITAYNHGREGIQRAISQVGSRDLMEIIRRYEGRAFGYASKNFYAEFLAAVEVAKNSEEFFPSLEYHPPFPLGEIEIERNVSPEVLLRRADISRAEFFDWNPALKPRAHSIPAGYRIKVPAERLEVVQTAYLGAIGKLPTRVQPTVSLGESAISWIRHRVARGQTLSQIARLYRVSVRELQHLNELADIHSITAGDYLRIPQR